MDAIIQVVEDWSKSKDRNLIVLAIFFDFAKAFDLVDHEVLLEKLNKQLPGWLVSWIAAYLSDRKQRVVVNNETTDWKEVEAGVIQGSVLGPIFFILFIADINDELPPNTNLQKYADDILAYIIGRTIPDGLLQEIVDAISRWCIKNKMRLNTEMMVLSNASDAFAQNVTLNDKSLEIVSTYKYLGIELNNTLDWNKQWDRV